MSKISLPSLMLVIVVVGISVFLMTTMPSDGGRQSRSAAPAQPVPVAPADCKHSMCYEVRRDGSKIITRGDIALRIPITAATWSVVPRKEIELTPAAVCFPGPGDPPPCEDAVPAFSFWIRKGSLEFVRAESADERLSRMTERYEGPIEGPAGGVSAYLGKTDKIYVLPEKDASGHFVVAKCYAECRVRNHVLPGLFADYRFPSAFIGQWPELDHAIRHYFEAVRMTK